MTSRVIQQKCKSPAPSSGPLPLSSKSPAPSSGPPPLQPTARGNTAVVCSSSTNDCLYFIPSGNNEQQEDSLQATQQSSPTPPLQPTLPSPSSVSPPPALSNLNPLPSPSSVNPLPAASGLNPLPSPSSLNHLASVISISSSPVHDPPNISIPELDFYVQDKTILHSTSWITDGIMAAAQSILQKQTGGKVNGWQSPQCCKRKGLFSVVLANEPFIQVLHLPTHTGQLLLISMLLKEDIMLIPLATPMTVEYMHWLLQLSLLME